MSWWKPLLKWIGKQALAYAGEQLAEKAAEKKTPRRSTRRVH